MAQIIKHRRGSITQLKDVTARIGELVVATGSISDLNGPMVFVGETEGVAGAYRPLSKIYQGVNAPTITVGSHGSVIDGTPFYATSDKTLYILSKDGNTDIDLTGNIEGNTINNVTITSLTGSNANVTNITGTTISGSNVNISSTLKVSSTTDLGGNLNVTGNTILNGSVTVTGLTDNRLVVVGNGGLLEDSADLTFDGTKFDIGQGQFQVDTATGDIRTSGSIVMKGNITVGDSNTDNIILAGEVSSSIIPDVHNAFDLGSSSQNWRNLHVSGTAYVNILEAQSISLDGITVFEDLVVSGSSYLGTGGGDQVIVSGSIYNDALTNNRVVIAGTNGLLEDDANFTFDGTTLNVGEGDFEIDVNDGDIRTSGSLLVKNNATVSGSMSVDGHINLTNEAQIRVNDDTLNTIYGFYNGSSILGPYYQMFGSDYSNAVQRGGAEFVFDSTNGGQGGFNIAEYNGSTWLRKLFVDASGLAVTGTTTLNGNLIVTGTTEMKDSVGINSSLTVTGSATLKDNLSVSGTTTVSGATTLQSTLTVDSTSELKGATTMNSSLDVTGSATLKNTLSVSGATSFADSVSLVSGNTLYVNHIADYGNADLDITTVGDLVLESSQNLSVQLRTDNDENGTNYLNVNSSSVNFSTYDDTSNLTHRVLLDNTGSLRFENVNIGITGSLSLSGSLNVGEDVIVHRNLYVSGNLELLGTSSYVNISSSQVDLGTNIINLNTYAPFERFAGISVYDSGSNAGVTGSILWDSVNNVWVYANPAGASYASARFIAGPKNTGSLGEETGLTVGHFPIATGDDHISDSLLTYLGTTLAFNTNKFTVDSSSGDATISGNFTLSYSGGTDNGNNTSAIMFRNSSNVVGFVSTTESEDVLDGILGYKNSDGSLKFSTVIDGGVY